MRIELKISLETDGDYSLSNHENYNMKWDGSGYYNSFTFTPSTPAYNFEDEHDIEMSLAWRACRLLEKMICDIHVYYTHYYLIDDLFMMFNEAIEMIAIYPIHFETSISGNYEGTFIELYCKEE